MYKFLIFFCALSLQAQAQNTPERDSFSYVLGPCGEGTFYSFFNEWVTEVKYEFSGSTTFTPATPVSVLSFGRLTPGKYTLKTTVWDTSSNFNTYLDSVTITNGHDISAKMEALSEPNQYKITVTDKLNNPTLKYTWFIMNSLGIIPLDDTLSELTVQVWEQTLVCAVASIDQGCHDTTCFTLSVDPSGIQLIDEKARIYPNPCRTFFSLESNRPVQEIRMYDIQGNLVRKKEIMDDSSTQMDVAGLAKGIYMVTLLYADGTLEQQKIAVTH